MVLKIGLESGRLNVLQRCSPCFENADIVAEENNPRSLSVVGEDSVVSETQPCHFRSAMIGIGALEGSAGDALGLHG